MRRPYLRLYATLVLAVGCDFVLATAQTPAPNLPLTCPSAGAVGQSQDNCSGLTYQQPTSDQLIVLRSNGTWARAASLAAADTLTVCAIAVQPGAYSSCRDSAGVRRLIQLPKSQVFPSSPPMPPPSGARILDLSQPPVQITQQGVYVLDRNWRVSEFAPPGGVILIAGDGVTLDLQGFELIVESNTAIVSSGSIVFIRNGTVYAEGGTAIRTSSVTTIEHVLAVVSSGTAVDLGGRGSTFTESTASASLSGTGLRAGDDTIVRNSTVAGRTVALNASSRTVVTGNDIGCEANFGSESCIEIMGTDNIFSGNRIRASSEGVMDALVIRGNSNHAMDNVFATTCGFLPRSPRAIVVEGQGNTIRDNLVPACAGSAGWENGLVFLRDGNLYGDNLIWATVPFLVGATVQTDLGGNVGLSN